MTIIKGKGFVLRPVKVSDSNKLMECYQDKDTIKNYRVGYNNLKDVQKYCQKCIDEFRKKKPEREKWIIDIDGDFAGWVTLSNMNQKYSEHVAYIGYCIHPKFRGRGLATGATKLISDYAFKKYKLKRLSAICRTFNKASAKVLENSGFKLEGIMRNNTFKDGKYFDDMLWAKVK